NLAKREQPFQRIIVGRDESIQAGSRVVLCLHDRSTPVRSAPCKCGTSEVTLPLQNARPDACIVARVNQSHKNPSAQSRPINHTRKTRTRGTSHNPLHTPTGSCSQGKYR